MHAFTAAVPKHVSLQSLVLRDFPLDSAAVLDAVVASLLTTHLETLFLWNCHLSPASVPPLARLLRGDVLTYFTILGDGQQLFDEPAAAMLAGAFSASRILLTVQLSYVGFWRNAAGAAAVMKALTGHPSLQHLWLSGNNPSNPYEQAAVGRALAALIAANTPSLCSLCVQNSALGDEGMRPLLDALEHNTHLRKFSCKNTGMSEAFVRERFLPAARTNTSLRKLEASGLWGGIEHGQAPPEVLEAEALVAARAAADAAA